MSGSFGIENEGTVRSLFTTLLMHALPGNIKSFRSSWPVVTTLNKCDLMALGSESKQVRILRWGLLTGAGVEAACQLYVVLVSI